MQFGDLTLTLVNGGNFRLDGGAMHGVVPKTIWNRLVSCDELNRVEYATNCLLVEGRGKRTLIETGNGDKFPARERDIYGIDHDQSAEKNLRALGVEPESIDYVVDDPSALRSLGRHDPAHGVAAASSRCSSARVTSSSAASSTTRRTRTSATAPATSPRTSRRSSTRGCSQLVEGEREFAPGVRVIPTPGHTRGHQSVLIDDGHGHKALFLGDVVPTALHVKLPFIMAYDLDVVGTLETKRRILGRAIDERWLVVFGHDKDLSAGYLGYDAKGNITVVERAPIS